MYKNLICMLLVLTLTSCSFFQIRRPIIEQGNIITNENVSKLHKGMSPTQVVDIMGSPVLANILTPNRIVYVYTYQDRTNPRITKRVTCVFINGSLKEIQRSE